MKVTGRNIKRRLYGLKKLPSNLKRARYFRGHGVHSPYVYALVRQVFMRSTFIADDKALFNQLIAKGVPGRRAMQLQNVMAHCGYESFCVDSEVESFVGYDMVVATVATPHFMLASMAQKAAEAAVTLCIISPAMDSDRDRACREIVQEHKCTSVDNRAYLIIFNNHLPKQKFRL